MEKLTNFPLFCHLLFFTTIFTGVQGGHRHHGRVKLFVFGDSYSDTGNTKESSSTAWKPPYGVTFPGRPTGRFSDGRVLADYIAAYFDIRSPVAYQWRRKIVKKSAIRHGMDFAYGGTGVFDTLVNGPNMTTQIQFFQRLVNHNLYSKCDLHSSVALVSLAGNDYAAYFARNGTTGLAGFIKSVVRQLAKNMKVIHEMGVRKIAVTGVEPGGCLPAVTTFTSYQSCIEELNSASKFHNQILRQAVLKLNKRTNSSTFVVLDLYNAFMAAFTRKMWHAGPLKFKDPLKPCCEGITDGYSCGSVDSNGVKKYVVCDNPAASFFWDNLHPSNSGWHAIYESLRSTLHKLHL